MLYRQSSGDPVQPRFERLQQQQQQQAPGRNQELNSRLQMKADELERLFAEHKRRRAPGAAGDHRRREAEESSSESWRSIGCSRGELYERYMEKRESKLRKEERGLKREERSAAMKALRESLERTSAELKLQQELRTMMKRDGRRDQVLLLQLVKKNFSEKEEEEEEEDEQSDTNSYKSVNSKLLPTRRTMSSSSVGRNSNSSLNRAIPRPSPSATVVTATGNSARGSGSGSKNSSDARKENTKPSSISIAGSKPSTNLGRSKSTSSTGLSSSSSSTPSRKLSATPLKPLTVLPKEQSGPAARAEKPKSAAHDDVGASSPTASSAASASGRARKKWASVAGPDAASCQPPRKDTGIKRLLQFGRKKKQGAESVVDAECSPAGGARDDREDGAVAAVEVVMSKSRLETNFRDGAIALERGVPRSFFSLPPFRNREGDSKLGR